MVPDIQICPPAFSCTYAFPSVYLRENKKICERGDREKRNKRRREEGNTMCSILFPSKKYQSGCSRSIFPKVCGHLTIMAPVWKHAYICRTLIAVIKYAISFLALKHFLCQKSNLLICILKLVLRKTLVNEPSSRAGIYQHP